MRVQAAIQAERNGRVYMIMEERNEYFWVRSTPGTNMHGPFQSLYGVYADMADNEGKTSQHWQKVFAFFYPNLLQSSPIKRLSVE